MAEDILFAQQVRKEFGGLVAVNDVDFAIPQGGIVGLIGPNGAGKTTFFNMLTGVYKPTSGLIDFDGNDVTDVPPHIGHEAGRGADVPEHPPVPVHDRARERARRHAPPPEGRHPRLHLRDAARAARGEGGRARAADDLLEFCGLKGRDDTLARNLPYGDQRRLEVARALATEPEAPAPRRADGRHEPAGDRRVHPVRLASSARSRG